MKTALVLEGGAMQGIYTAGVLDMFMGHKVSFDGVIGVSAGALFGVNFLSGQQGRGLRYNKKYNKNPNYMGLWPLIKEGNIVGTDYAYHTVPCVLDPFDDEAFMASGIPFYAVLTDIVAGKAEYRLIESVYRQMDELRASGSMPYVSKPVEIGGKLYLDGAVCDSIPYDYMLEHGYDRVVVVLTKPADYVKKPLPVKLTERLYGKDYPNFAQAVESRHLMYKRQQDRLSELAEKGIAKVIRPSESYYVNKLERNNKKLQKLYDLGLKDAMDFLKKESV
ncbi:MAG: patatin family protein [Lachnospiraceae bacterium]|nr:patatin family protein [Lachnospiraceae bacterium]